MVGNDHDLDLYTRVSYNSRRTKTNSALHELKSGLTGCMVAYEMNTSPPTISGVVQLQ